jgi:sporulation protein YlmC with PRC-barrel domain
MNRLLISSAVGLFIGMTPAIAQDQAPQDPSSPPALEAPSSSDSPSIIDDSLSAGRDNSLSSSEAMPPASSSEALPSTSSEPGSSTSQASPPAADEAMPPSVSSEVSPSEPSSSQSSEAPQPITPPDSSAANQVQQANEDDFLRLQSSSDYLASSLVGESVTNAKNETIGTINDIVTDKDGKIVAVLINAGGFLGIGGKDVAVRFQDLTIERDAGNDLTVSLNMDQDMIASAPDYQRLDEQQIVQGENKSDAEKPSTY